MAFSRSTLNSSNILYYTDIMMNQNNYHVSSCTHTILRQLHINGDQLLDWWRVNQLVTSLQERIGVGKQKLHKFLEAEGTQSHRLV